MLDHQLVLNSFELRVDAFEPDSEDVSVQSKLETVDTFEVTLRCAEQLGGQLPHEFHSYITTCCARASGLEETAHKLIPDASRSWQCGGATLLLEHAMRLREMAQFGELARAGLPCLPTCPTDAASVFPWIQTAIERAAKSQPPARLAPA